MPSFLDPQTYLKGIQGAKGVLETIRNQAINPVPPSGILEKIRSQVTLPTLPQSVPKGSMASMFGAGQTLPKTKEKTTSLKSLKTPAFSMYGSGKTPLEKTEKAAIKAVKEEGIKTASKKAITSFAQAIPAYGGQIKEAYGSLLNMVADYGEERAEANLTRQKMWLDKYKDTGMTEADLSSKYQKAQQQKIMVANELSSHAEQVINSGREIAQAHSDAAQYKIPFLIGSGTLSIGTAVAVGAITGGTTLPAVTLSAIEALPEYKQAKDKLVAGGMNEYEAQSRARKIVAISGTGTAISEKIGLDFLMGNIGGKIMKTLFANPVTRGIAKGTGETVQEYSQQVWQNSVKRVGYDKTQEVFENVSDTFWATFPITALIGVGVSVGEIRAEKTEQEARQKFEMQIAELDLSQSDKDKLWRALKQNAKVVAEKVYKTAKTSIKNLAEDTRGSVPADFGLSELTPEQKQSKIEPVNPPTNVDRQGEVPDAMANQPELPGESGKISQQPSEVRGDTRGSVIPTGKRLQSDINNQAREIAKKPISQITEEDRAVLRKYEGAGGRESNGEAGRGLLDEYYTPRPIVKEMWDFAKKYGFKDGGSVLEPSAGTGRFIEEGPDATYTASEIDETAAKIATVLTRDKGATVYKMPFEEMFVDKEGNKKPVQTYDLVIGNPPYGSHRGYYRTIDQPRIQKYEEYFIKRGLDSLKPDGTLVMVVPSGFLKTASNKAKQLIAEQGELVDAKRLPEGTFGTTSIGTDILVFKKSKGDAGAVAQRVNTISGDSYFMDNPDKIAGEVKTRINRWKKEETYVAKKKDRGEPEYGKQYSLTGKDSIMEGKTWKEAEVKTEEKKTEPYDIDKEIAKAKAEKGVGGRGVQKAKLDIIQPKGPASQYYKSAVPYTEEELAIWAAKRPDGSIDESKVDVSKLNKYKGKYYDDFEYQSGNIYEKLDALKKENLSEEDRAKQEKKLNDVFPKKKTVKELDINPIGQFSRDFKVGDETLDGMFKDYVRELPNAAFAPSSGGEVIGYLNDDAVRTYGNKKLAFTIKQRRKVVAEKLYKTFLENIDPKVKADIEDQMNRRINGYVRPDYKKVPLSVNGLDATFGGRGLKMPDYKLDSIGFLTNKGLGINANGVGLGKTMMAIISTVQDVQQGRYKRPLFIVPRQVYRKWIDEITQLFPGQKVVGFGNLGTKYNVSRSEDIKDVIKDGDITVMTHEAIMKIGFEEETIADLSAEISNAYDESAVQDKTERAKELESAKKEEMLGKGKAKAGIKIENLGFDNIIVDEAHNFKNIFSRAKSQEGEKKFKGRWGGLQGPSSSRGVKLWFLSQYIQKLNGGRGVKMLTATPFSNNPLEYYNMLSLMAMDEMKSMGIDNINTFMDTFVKSKHTFVVKAGGKFEMGEVIEDWQNGDLLKDFIGRYIDFKDGEDYGVERPTKHIRDHRLNPTAEQLQLIDEAQELLEPKFKDQGGTLVYIDEAKKITLSPSLSRYYKGPAMNAKQFIETSPKLMAMMSMIKANKRKTGQLIYYPLAVDTMPLVKEYLVSQLGYKTSEVGIVSGSTTDAQRERIKEGFNDGSIKVIIGSDAVKEGIDLQTKATDLYITSYPWRPTDITQVEGRIHRQGNEYPNVRVHFLSANDTIDPFLFQKMETKARRLSNASALDQVMDVSDIDWEAAKADLIRDPRARLEVQKAQKKQKIELELSSATAEKAMIQDTLSKEKKLVEEINQDTELLKIYAKGSNMHDFYSKNLKKATQKLKDFQKKEINLDELTARAAELEAVEKAKSEEVKTIDAEFVEKAKGLQEYRQIEPAPNDFTVFENQIAEENKTFLQKKEKKTVKETESKEITQKELLKKLDKIKADKGIVQEVREDIQKIQEEKELEKEVEQMRADEKMKELKVPPIPVQEEAAEVAEEKPVSEIEVNEIEVNEEPAKVQAMPELTPFRNRLENILVEYENGMDQIVPPEAVEIVPPSDEPPKPKEPKPKKERPERPKPQKVDLSKLDRVRVVFQDSMLPAERLQKKAGAVTEDEDIYMAEELYSGRVTDAIETFQKEKEDPIRKKIDLLTKGENQALLKGLIQDYLHLKHAPERNKAHYDGAAGIKTSEALERIKLIELHPRFQDIKLGASLIRELASSLPQFLQQNELITDETFEVLNKVYKEYVPLNRIMDDETDFVNTLGIGKGFDIRGNEVKRAVGSRLQVDDIFANVVSNWERAIMRAEKNKVGQSVYSFATKYPELGVFEIMPAIPVHLMDKDGGDYWVRQAPKADNILSVKLEGKSKYIKINDPNLASALKNLNVDNSNLLIKLLGPFTRYISMINTSLNPEFWLGNFSRDIQQSTLNNINDMGFRKAVKTSTKVFSAQKGIMDFYRGKDTEMSRLYKELKAEGGTTGFFNIRNKEDIDALLRTAEKVWSDGAIGMPMKMGKKVAEAISVINDIVENGTRLATYQAALEMGKSKARAAQMAKNITVNFNKKGQLGPTFNALYTFSNASIQGSFRTFKSLKNPKTAIPIITSIVMLSLALNAWNDWYDEEGYARIPEYEKESNWIFMYGDGEYVKISLPWGFNVFKVAADYGYSMAKGDTSGKYGIVRTAVALVNAYNPIGGSSIGQILPTFFRPGFDIATNKSWAGYNIRPDNYTNIKESLNYFESTNDLFKSAAVMLSKATGGEGAKPGLIEMSPEDLEYIWAQYTGGIGTFLSRTQNALSNLFTGEETPINEVPFKRRVMGEVNIEKFNRNQMYDYLDRSKQEILAPEERAKLLNILKDELKAGRFEKEEAISKMKEYDRWQEDLQLVDEKAQYIKEKGLTGAKLGRFYEALQDKDFMKARGQDPFNKTQIKILKSYTGNAPASAEAKEKATEATTEKGLISAVLQYAKAFSVDPETAFVTLFTGEKLKDVRGDSVIMERMSFEKSTDVKKEMADGLVLDEIKLDHLVPLELGGSNSEKNLRIVTTEEWESFTPVENYLGDKLNSGEIGEKEAQKLIQEFKEGKITADDIYNQ